MNKSIFAASGILAFLMTGCGGQNGENEKNPIIEFGSFSYEAVAQSATADTARITEEDLCKVVGQGMLPVKIGNFDISGLQDSLCRLAQVIVIDKIDTQPLLDNDFVLTRLNPLTTETGSYMGNELTVSLLSPQLIVWKDFSWFSPYQAAHGTYSTTYVNYSLEKGKILQLSDIFVADYQERLLELIREKLVDDKVDLLVDINEVGIPNDFRLTTHTVDFIYGVYEIAPYSSGEIEVSLPVWELTELMAPETEETLFGTKFE